MKHCVSRLSVLLLSVLLSAGQVTVENLPPQLLEQLPPEEREKVLQQLEAQRLEKEKQKAAAAAAENAAAVSTAAEKQRLQQLLQLPFERRASAILQHLASQHPLTEIQQFQRDVITGHWKAVRKFLQALPPEHAQQVFARILQEFQRHPMQPIPQGAFVSSQPGQEVILFPSEVLEMADTAPAPLREDQAEQLGRLLAISLRGGPLPGSILKQLEEGTEQLGGSDPGKRRLAVLFLIAANRLLEAGPFLPPVEQALQVKDFKTVDLHARYLAAQSLQGHNPEALARSWELNQVLLAETNAFHFAALQRAMELLPRVRKEASSGWIQQTFQKSPEQGMYVLSALATSVQSSQMARDPERRRRDLESAHRVVEELLRLGPPHASWRQPLGMLTLDWIEEADLTKHRFVVRRTRSADPFNDPNAYYEEQMQMLQMQQYPNQSPPLTPDQLLAVAPSEIWLAVVDPFLTPRVRMLMGDLHLKVEAPEKVLAQIRLLAPDFPAEAVQLAQEFLKGWARARDPNPTQNTRGTVYVGGMPAPNPQGAPLTRALQVRNLKELSAALAEFKKLGLAQIETRAIVEAFIACHSRAEVYRMEDIVAVFGPAHEIEPRVLLDLVQAMRQRLGQQWRQPQMQQQARTRRTDKEIDAEIHRGYEVAVQLVEKGLVLHAGNPMLHALMGTLLFDWSEFLYGKKVDLAVYTEKRDAAFQAFHRAAALYGELARREEAEPSIFVYQFWFNTILGASDLAFLTRQHEPETNRLDQIKHQLHALPPDLRDRHLALFSKHLSDSLPSIPAELKPRYLRSGLRIVENHPAAEDSRRLMAYYEDLTQEVVLDVRVDGEPEVGHAEPFGVLVSLRYTEALGRENMGFIKYLQNQLASAGYYYYPVPGARGPTNYREDFEKKTREALVDGFEVLHIVFHDDKVQPRGFGKPGWRETPYAYLLVKARDASVDKIPPLQIDLDFSDKKGAVVLPITSQVRLIDARPAAAPRRPLAEVEVVQTLDARKQASGVLGLDLKITGKGILPPLDQLLDLNSPGFRVTKRLENPMSIARLDSEGERVSPISERVLSLQLARDSAAQGALFHFPKVRLDEAKVAYKQYRDADLVDVKPEVALAGVAVEPARRWPWVAGGLFLACAAAGLIWFLLTRRTAEKAQVHRYDLPAHITPFSVLRLLKTIHSDATLDWGEERKGELRQTIEEFETLFFSPRKNGSAEPNLQETASRWVAYTRNGH